MFGTAEIEDQTLDNVDAHEDEFYSSDLFHYIL